MRTTSRCFSISVRHITRGKIKTDQHRRHAKIVIILRASCLYKCMYNTNRFKVNVVLRQVHPSLVQNISCDQHTLTSFRPVHTSSRASGRSSSFQSARAHPLPSYRHAHGCDAQRHLRALVAALSRTSRSRGLQIQKSLQDQNIRALSSRCGDGTLKP